MSHLDPGLLQAYADGELPRDERSTLELHLGDCLPCRAELRDLRSTADELTAALAIFDATATTRTGPARRAGGATTGWVDRLAALPRAAVLVFGVAVAASAMIPGSPLQRWITAGPVEERTASAPEQEAVALSSAPGDPPPEAGVSIEPHEGAIHVVLRDASPELRVRASLSAGTRGNVFATGPAAAARFETAPGRILVEGLGAGELRIELPAAATAATVEVNGREYLRKRGEQLHLLVPADDRNGTEVNFHP